MSTRTPSAGLPCEIDPDAFHAPHGERVDSDEHQQRITQARELCIECPIMLACRDQGRELRERGIWGGETDDERAAAGYAPGPGQRERPDCGTEAGARWHRRRENSKPCRRCRTAERSARLAREAAASAVTRVHHLAA